MLYVLSSLESRHILLTLSESFSTIVLFLAYGLLKKCKQCLIFHRRLGEFLLWWCLATRLVMAPKCLSLCMYPESQCTHSAMELTLPLDLHTHPSWLYHGVWLSPPSHPSINYKIEWCGLISAALVLSIKVCTPAGTPFTCLNAASRSSAGWTPGHLTDCGISFQPTFSALTVPAWKTDYFYKNPVDSCSHARLSLVITREHRNAKLHSQNRENYRVSSK
jgi:hypothetical protein